MSDLDEALRTDVAKTQPLLERLSAGDTSRRRAAEELGIGYATLKRLLDGNFPAT